MKNRAVPEAERLLNPAFCGLVVRDMVEGYYEESDRGMPYELAFLGCAMILHEDTRRRLPPSISTKLHPWLQDNSFVRIGFEKRARALVPFVRRGIRFAFASGVLDADSHLRLTLSGNLRRGQVPSGTDLTAVRKAACFAGRWFARTGNPRSIFSLWGVQP